MKNPKCNFTKINPFTVHCLLITFFLPLSFILIHFSLNAHPSWGIAVAKNGDIYFADVMHNETGTLWKLTPDGQVSTVLTDFHAHNFTMGNDGTIWIGDDRWIQGEVEGEGIQTLLKISPNGKIDTILRTDDRDIFWGGNMVAGPDGKAFYCYKNTLFEVNPGGQPIPVIENLPKVTNTLYFDKDYQLWITNNRYKQGTIFKWTKQRGIEEFATHIFPEHPKSPLFSDKKHQLFFGLTKGCDGQIYVAESAERRVLKIVEGQKPEVFYQSEKNWSPHGIAFFQGDAYIMEVGYKGLVGHLGPRIIKISESGVKSELFSYDAYTNSDSLKKGQITTPKNSSNILQWLLPIFVMLIAGGWWTLKKIRRVKQAN